MQDTRWLLLLCTSRLGFALINTVYAALIPMLRPAWSMSASQAGAVQSAWHAGYIVSLVAASLLAGRFGARNTFLGMGWAACASAFVFAFGAQDFLSAFLLYGFAGLCAGGSYVPGLTLIAERFPSASRGRAMGAFIAAARWVMRWVWSAPVRWLNSSDPPAASCWPRPVRCLGRRWR
jgi:MFS family permease